MSKTSNYAIKKRDRGRERGEGGRDVDQDCCFHSLDNVGMIILLKNLSLL